MRFPASVRARAVCAALVLGAAGGGAHAQEPGADRPLLSLPVDCPLDVECFVQQMPDMAAGPETSDPFCGVATYDGHEGTDIRVRSLPDVARGVPVVAPAPGIVLRTRDGEADRLVERQADIAALKGRECGNGAIIDHGGGLTTQLCHLREGSLSVEPGQRVERGDAIGLLGVSGLAQFPHVEMVVRLGDRPVDPTSGGEVGAGCRVQGTTLWDEATRGQIGRPETQVLGLGIAGGPVTPEDLVASGAPAAPDATEPDAAVAWVWLINLRGGDLVRLTLTGPGSEVATSEIAIERTKAQYAAYAGRRNPGSGPFTARAEIVRDGEIVLEAVGP